MTVQYDTAHTITVESANITVLFLEDDNLFIYELIAAFLREIGVCLRPFDRRRQDIGSGNACFCSSGNFPRLISISHGQVLFARLERWKFHDTDGEGDGPSTVAQHSPAAEVNTEWNKSQPPGTPPIKERYDKPEFIPVKCNIHPWMHGWFVVLKTSHYDVSKEGGDFKLPNLPPGKYTITAWHGGLWHADG